MSLQDHYTRRPDGRAGDMAQDEAELIAWAEGKQTRPETRLNWWVIIGWPAMFAFAGLCWWGLIEAGIAIFK